MIFMDDVEDDENHVTEDACTVEEFFSTENNTQIAIPMVMEETAITILDKKKSIDTSHIWIGDLGASCHMTHNLEGMYDIKDEKFAVTIGNGKPIYAKKIGKWKDVTEQRDGTSSYITSNFIAFVPIIFVNLFSITQALWSGSNLYNKKEIIYVEKGHMTIAFDHITNT